MKSHYTRGSKLCNASDRTKTSPVSHISSPDKSGIMCTTKGVFNPSRIFFLIMFTFRASHPSYSSCPFPKAFYNLTSPRNLTRCQHVFIAIVIFYNTNASTFSLPDSLPTARANAPQPLPLTANTLPSSSCSSHLTAHSLSPPPPPRQDYDNNLIAPPPFALSPLCTSSFPSSSSSAASSSLSFHLIAIARQGCDFFYGLSVSASLFCKVSL